MGGSIRAIDKSSVQKICCGQVVVDLCGAVKEVSMQSMENILLYTQRIHAFLVLHITLTDISCSLLHHHKNFNLETNTTYFVLN